MADPATCSTAAAQAPDDRALVRRWHQDGDIGARDALINRYLPLARKLAARYAHSSEPIEDLAQVAAVGLIKAIARFDPDRNERVAAFAVPTILGELRRHFRDACWTIHVPRGMQERALAIEQATRRLTTVLGRAPTVAELAAETDLGVEQVLNALQASSAYGTASLDAPRHGADGEIEPLLTSLGAEDPAYDFIDASDVVVSGLPLLSDRERQVLYLRFAKDLTQTEIAERIGVSQMQVSRLLRRSMTRLRDFAEGELTIS
jgi:RNA polymerase sigma-B factor